MNLLSPPIGSFWQLISTGWRLLWFSVYPEILLGGIEGVLVEFHYVIARQRLEPCTRPLVLVAAATNILLPAQGK